MNHQIRLSPVRLIGADGTQHGIVPIEEARQIARQDGLDLVEVDANSRPIVCKVLDWGKAKYEQAKKEKLAKRHEKTLELKQVKFRPGVSEHDFLTKCNHARRFLVEGKRTKVTLMFRRRDLRRPENGFKVLTAVVENLKDVGKVETMPRKIENRDLTMVLIPLAGIGHSVKKPKLTGPATPDSENVAAKAAPPEPKVAAATAASTESKTAAAKAAPAKPKAPLVAKAAAAAAPAAAAPVEAPAAGNDTPEPEAAVTDPETPTEEAAS